MRQRSAILVMFFTLLTFGLYGLHWLVVTKEEMNSERADIPTAWLLIIPLVNLYWYWKWCEGVEQVTRGRTSTIGAFLMIHCLSVVGMAIIQDSFNRTACTSTLPMARALG